MTVPATTAFRVSRKRLLNGQAVTFRGRIRTLPTPAGGKLVEMQVRLPGRWETFRTVRSDDAGQWSAVTASGAPAERSTTDFAPDSPRRAAIPMSMASRGWSPFGYVAHDHGRRNSSARQGSRH